MSIAIRYDSPNEKGETRRQINEAFDMAHLTPEAPEVEGGERIERIFWTLSRFRTQGFSGPDPLQPGTIRDWCHLTGRSLDPDELRVILEMDAAFLAACRREGTAESEGG